MKKAVAVILAVAMAAGMLAGCGQEKKGGKVILFSPYQRVSEPHDEKGRQPMDISTDIATDATGITLEFRSYHGERYTDISYDDACRQRIRGKVDDDLYYLNPDVLLELAKEGLLTDLSGLKCVPALSKVASGRFTIDGTLYGIPMNLLAYGLVVNTDMLDANGLKVPETPEEFISCCRVLKENGITPVCGNRWWLECFVLTQAFAGLYKDEGADGHINAINSDAEKLSDYMRPGFEFLKTLIDEGYLDAELAATREAMDEAQDFVDGRCAFCVSHNSGFVNGAKYGAADFGHIITGFPTDEGPTAVINAGCYAIPKATKNADSARKLLDALMSTDSIKQYCELSAAFSPRSDAEPEPNPAFEGIQELIDNGNAIAGSLPQIKVEQWGNTCDAVAMLLGGATVDECMLAVDGMQGLS